MRTIRFVIAKKPIYKYTAPSVLKISYKRNIIRLNQ